MTDDAILALVKKALHDVEPERTDDWSEVTLDRTIQSLELDSIKTMEMVGFLEDHTDVVFEDDALSRVQSLGDLARLIQTA